MATCFYRQRLSPFPPTLIKPGKFATRHRCQIFPQSGVVDTGGKQWEQYQTAKQLKVNLKEIIYLYANEKNSKRP
jgi:hypothetical protein